ncbi:Uncharacterised protein [Serratia grimesii]|uniref:hypothetical protein n=1 Tax=Serratia grimesii TaxID=82995 RepID=UPI002179C279|nr:hypothetical protein [Serratia grimesii]CAI1840664.1 Uncharacterised protein [Serratia grimesii]
MNKYLLALIFLPSVCISADGVGVARDADLNAIAKEGAYACTVHFRNAAPPIGSAVLAVGRGYPLKVAFQLFSEGGAVMKMAQLPDMKFDTKSPLTTSYVYRQPDKGFPLKKLNMVFIDPVNGISASIYEEINGKTSKELSIKNCKDVQ